jgi:cytochrome c-type biogenesis protein CcmH
MTKCIRGSIMQRVLFVVVFAALLLFAPTTVLAVEEWQTRQIPLDVESGVVCILDNCMMNLSACDTPAAQKLREVIREKMFKEGLSKEQTYAYLAQVYGEKALTAPPKKGFNWVAWLTPFIAIAGGVAIVYLGLERWVYSGNVSEEEFEAEIDETDEIVITYEEKIELEQEIKRYL